MGLFGNLTTDGLEKQEERVGGGFSVRSSDIYTMTIKVAYVTKSTSSKAQAVNLVLVDDAGKEYTETVWVTNGNGDNKYEIKKDGKGTGKFAAQPGFKLINDIAIIAVDKPLNALVDEEKQILIYDFEAKKKLPKAVPVFTELSDKRVAVAIRQTKSFKQKKNPSTGQYEDTAETRDENNIEMAFFPQFKTTVREAEEALDEKNGGKVEGDTILTGSGDNAAVFWDAWLNNWKGKVYDKTAKAGGNNGNAGKPAPVGNGGSAPETQRASLFGNKG